MGNQSSTRTEEASRTDDIRPIDQIPSRPTTVDEFGEDCSKTVQLSKEEKGNSIKVPDVKDEFEEMVSMLFSELSQKSEHNFNGGTESNPGEAGENIAVKNDGVGQNESLTETLTPPPSSPSPTPELKKVEKKKIVRKKHAVRTFTKREIKNGKVIGEGGFGRILRGTLHGKPVAIKFFHSPLSPKTLQNELDALMSLKHKNIIEVFGIIEQIDAIDCPQVVLQFFPEGNVLQYLSKKENPQDINAMGKFTVDIIEGCQYLQQKKIIHGNLAARNILIEKIVGQQKTFYNAKISDMAIIRFAEATGSNYVKIPGSDRVVPLRWVPKEIVDVQKDGSTGSDFTFASDVWSFGVVLWEIWTRGAIPYGASYSNMRVIQFLKEGYSPLKVHKPAECSRHVVSVMEHIFQMDPNDRPTFDMLYQQFRSFKGYGMENKLKNVKGLSQNKQIEADNGVTAPSDIGTASQLAQKGEEHLNENSKKKKTNFNKSKTSIGDEATFPHEGATSLTPVPVEIGRDVRPHSSTSFQVKGSQGPKFSSAPKLKTAATQQSDEVTIAALLQRVKQLEREQERGDRRQGGGDSRGGPNRRQMWDKRVGPPRFTNPYHGNGNNGSGIGSVGTAPAPRLNNFNTMPRPPPPRYASLPPPYTEEPLANHSSPMFTPHALPQEYSYSGPSRGHRGGASRGGGGTKREDYLQKVRELAEEIEVLRAEKMTQELLKRSAELADIMKQMHMSSNEVTEQNSRYSSPRPVQGPPRRGYYDEYNYNYSQAEETGWSGMDHQDLAPTLGDVTLPTHAHRMPDPYQHQQAPRREYKGKRGYGKRGGRGGPQGGSSNSSHPGNGQ